jgi:23S rRNA (cytidine1920-2'-O)/16S rRNA (cytidine1409-2'-O)-methyltransferase
MPRVRADSLLVARGVFTSRAAAQAAIEAGLVLADGAPVAKSSSLVEEGATLHATAPHPYVSRGGVKLAHALQAFGVDPKSRVCLDIGASTGGFTDCLLQAGAAHVVAVDVGRDQMAARLRAHRCVTNLEGLDARALTRAHVPENVNLIVADVSFIGLAKALPQALALAASNLDLITLIKPQFESGPGKRDGRGNLNEEAARAIATQAAQGLQEVFGLTLAGLIDSPILGGGGAHEFLAHARRNPSV